MPIDQRRNGAKGRRVSRWTMSAFAAQGPLTALAKALMADGYAFACVTPATHRLVNARVGSETARTPRDVFGWNRPFATSVLPFRILREAMEAGVLAPHPAGHIARVRAATLDGLLLLHSAFPTDSVDAVFLGPDTYRFARAVTDNLSTRTDITRAIDLGCGTGAAGLLIARACPWARVILTDVNRSALAAARVNAASNGLGNVQFCEADVFNGATGPFDLIVANPPYLVDPAKRTYRHGGGELGGALSLRIATESLGQLSRGGVLVLYTGSAIVEGRCPLLEAISPMLKPDLFDWSYSEADPDVFGEELANGPLARAERIAAVTLTVRRRR